MNFLFIFDTEILDLRQVILLQNVAAYWFGTRIRVIAEILYVCQTLHSKVCSELKELFLLILHNSY